MQLGLTGLREDGQALDEDWPYGEPAWPADPPAGAADPRNRVIPGAWRSLGHVSFGKIRQVLEKGNAVILSLRFVPNAWFDVGTDALVDAPPGGVVVDGHAVLAVGISTFVSGDVVEFKNSWGTTWGDQGYGYLASAYWKRYGKRAFALAPSS